MFDMQADFSSCTPRNRSKSPWYPMSVPPAKRYPTRSPWQVVLSQPTTFQLSLFRASLFRSSGFFLNLHFSRATHLHHGTESAFLTRSHAPCMFSAAREGS